MRSARARRRLAGLILTALTLAACGGPVDGVGVVALPACPAAFFGVAGSGEGPQNPAPTSVPAGLRRSDVAAYGQTIAVFKRLLTEVPGAALGSAAAIDYPAVSADKYLRITGPTSALDRSEAAGASVLTAAVRAKQARPCEDRPILLAGYSQGAEVVIRAVNALSASSQRHVSVVLLGNPSYEPRERGDYPAHVRESGLRPTFVDGQAFRLAASVRRRTLDVCAPGDPICGVPAGLPTVLGRLYWVYRHVAVYKSDAGGYTTTAARFLWAHRVRR